MKEAAIRRLSVDVRPPYHPPVEIVERKGRGHPDTLCDQVAEWASRWLAESYLARTGRVQHHNVDKGLLVAGAVEVGFGGGRHLRPARLTIAGRAELQGWRIEREELLRGMRSELARLLPDASTDAFTVDLHVDSPSEQLAPLTAVSEQRVPLANDTSFAVVSLPRSPLENAVHALTEQLNGAELRRTVPVGPDVKVMGSRQGNRVRITVAAAMLARRVTSTGEYRAAVEAVHDVASTIVDERFGSTASVAVNHASSRSPYLTLSGSSAEAGDDGQVGRGNRFGGLITPCRPMSMEACAGKNPVSHVGKTYHCVAHDIARRLLAEADAVEATVGLLSRIGDSVTRPALVQVETARPTDQALVRAIVEESLADWAGIRDRLLTGSYELF
ncbi:MAG: methionine adenosyltransferase [Actinomycetota bacterium]